MRSMKTELRNAREFAQELKKKLKRKECLHPESPDGCKGKIVKAHTVQKAFLKAIARNNHIYAPAGELGLALRGIRQASTFTGYCAYHDDELFAPIEKRALRVNEHHSFLLAYRAMGKEIFNKQILPSLMMWDFGAANMQRPENERVLGAVIEDPAYADLVRQDHEVFHKMGNAYIEQDFSKARYFAIALNRVPDILCSGMTNVEFDFNGKRLQSVFQEHRQDLITLSLLPFRSNRGIAIFAWYGESDVNVKFIRSLESLGKHEIPDALIRFIFEHFDNFFAAPNWWENLSATAHQSLLERFQRTLSFESYVFIDLRPDGMRYVDWNATGISTNLKR